MRFLNSNLEFEYIWDQNGNIWDSGTLWAL